MTHLSDRPPLMPDEPLNSFASRTARCYGTDLATLCHEVGVPLRGLGNGTAEAARRLAELTALNPSELAEQAFRKDGSLWHFKGQSLHRRGVRRLALNVCPTCLRDDLDGSPSVPHSAYVRAHWLVRAVRTCVVHGIALVHVVEPVTPVGEAIHDLAGRIAPMLGEVGRLSDGARRKASTSLERYAVDRLHGRPVEGGLADAMPLHAGTRTCEMLGAVMLFGPDTPLPTLDGDAWRAAGDAGFDVVSRGREVVAGCLSALMRNHGGANRNTGAHKIYGRLYEWLKTKVSEPDYDPIRDLLREVIVEGIPMAAGTDVLGVRLDRRRVHSLRSAAAETGRSLKGLDRDLRASGIVPSHGETGSERLVAIPVETTAEAMKDFADSVPRQEAAAYLGASLADVSRLVAAGLLVPVAPKQKASASHVRFSRRTLAAFLEDVMAGVTEVTSPLSDMRTIPAAARASQRKLESITDLLIRGRLRHVTSAPNARGFRSVLVDIGEIEAWDGGSKQQACGAASYQEAAERLRVVPLTVRRLIATGHLEAGTLTMPLGTRCIKAVGGRSLDRFASKLVSLAEIGDRLGMHHGAAMRLLDAKCIRQAIPYEAGLCRFYRRCDVEATTATP